LRFLASRFNLEWQSKWLGEIGLCYLVSSGVLFAWVRTWFALIYFNKAEGVEEKMKAEAEAAAEEEEVVVDDAVNV